MRTFNDAEALELLQDVLGRLRGGPPAALLRVLLARHEGPSPLALTFPAAEPGVQVEVRLRGADRPLSRAEWDRLVRFVSLAAEAAGAGEVVERPG
jgi:hypothetical protein